MPANPSEKLTILDIYLSSVSRLLEENKKTLVITQNIPPKHLYKLSSILSLNHQYYP